MVPYLALYEMQSNKVHQQVGKMRQESEESVPRRPFSDLLNFTLYSWSVANVGFDSPFTFAGSRKARIGRDVGPTW